jgi:hypothetical protein
MAQSVEQLSIRAGITRNRGDIPSTRRNSAFSDISRTNVGSQRLLFKDNLVFFRLPRPKLDRTPPPNVNVKNGWSLLPLLP